mmetsp:Transcript_28382/g.25103  ORF Transcript_28382/g.25103 Transcript_28382/m.25103 type:complete len:492 (+) Transcript_28382:63-1538(+)
MMTGRKNKKFDSLLADNYEIPRPFDKYGSIETNNYEGRNKEIRNIYPASGGTYDPHNRGKASMYNAEYQSPAPVAPIPHPPAYQYQPGGGYEPVPQPGYYEHPAYAVPKYAQEYSSPPKRQFVENTSRRKLQEAQNNYYAKKRLGQGTTFSERSLSGRSEELNPRQRGRKDRFEDFVKYTAPRLQYKKIVLIQALLRGAYVRKKVFPQIQQFHVASVRTVDSMIDHYIEDVYIPDLLLEILTKNKVYENFDLYSDENKILYEVRYSIMEKVIRDMVKDTVKQCSDNIVNRYLNKRFRDKDVDERDPMSMVVKGFMDGVMKAQIKEIVQDSVQDLSLDYLIQAQFNSLFNRVWLPKEVEHTVLDAIEDLAVQDVIDGVVEDIIRQEAPRIAEEAMEAERDRQDDSILENAFGEYADRGIHEVCVLNMARIYENEESNIHVKEQQEKALRDHAKQKSNQVKQEYRDLNKELENEQKEKRENPNLDPQGFAKKR